MSSKKENLSVTSAIRDALECISPALVRDDEIEMLMLYDVLGHIEYANSIEDSDERQDRLCSIKDCIKRMGN